MGTAYLYGNGDSGGGGLNFKVVGNPKPTNPKENTIWIDTDEKITGWYFSPDDMSCNLDKANAANDKNVFSSVSNGVCNVPANKSSAWTSTYIAKAHLVAGITYTVRAVLGYGRIGVCNSPTACPAEDNLLQFSDFDNPHTTLYSTVSERKLTPTKTTDAYFWYCTDRANTNNAKPAFSFSLTLDMPNMDDGTVWIQTDVSGPVEFNALKKNTIQVFPQKAYQLIGGSLKKVVASCFIGGQWRDIKQDLVLYDYTKGGWQVPAFTAEVKKSNSYGIDAVLSVTTNTDGSLNIAMNTSCGSSVYYSKDQTYDLSEYSELYFEGSTTYATPSTNSGLCIWSSMGTYWLDNIIARVLAVNGNATIPLTSINKTCVIGFGFYDITNVVMKKLILRC